MQLNGQLELIGVDGPLVRGPSPHGIPLAARPKPSKRVRGSGPLLRELGAIARGRLAEARNRRGWSEVEFVCRREALRAKRSGVYRADARLGVHRDWFLSALVVGEIVCAILGLLTWVEL